VAECQAICVDPKRVAEFWPHVYRWIHRAIQRGGLGRFADVERDVLEGHALLWLAWDGETILCATVTKLVISDVDKVCLILACGGGSVRRWIALIERIEGYARDEGCDVVRLMGRPGWISLLPHYRADKVILERAL
jgi:hypothetical protein